jgi:hypothetical protein
MVQNTVPVLVARKLKTNPINPDPIIKPTGLPSGEMDPGA